MTRAQSLLHEFPVSTEHRANVIRYVDSVSTHVISRVTMYDFHYKRIVPKYISCSPTRTASATSFKHRTCTRTCCTTWTYTTPATSRPVTICTAQPTNASLGNSSPRPDLVHLWSSWVYVPRCTVCWRESEDDGERNQTWIRLQTRAPRVYVDEPTRRNSSDSASIACGVDFVLSIFHTAGRTG